MGLDKRQFLQFGLGALGLAAGLQMRGSRALAASGEPLKIVDLEGGITPVIDEMTKDGAYFQQFGLDATISNVTDGSRVIAALVSGTGDLCAGSGFSGVFPAIGRGAKIKIVAGVTSRPVVALYSKRPDILSTHDLIGKTVGIGPLGALLHQLSVALMIKQGVDYTKVNFVNVGNTVDVFRATVAGTVDAGYGSAEIYSERQKYGVHALTDGVLWNELPDFTDQVMIASDRAIAEKRDELVKLLAARAKLFRFIASPDSQASWAKARAAALGRDDPAEAEAQWRFFNAPGLLMTDLILTPERFDFVQQLNVKLGAQSKVLPFDQTADMSMAQDALKLLA